MWTPLSKTSVHQAERFGHKAVRLAEASARGLRIPESLVLECEELSRLRRDPSRADARARELLELLPNCERVLFRSSSPLEDRRQSSAAGLLPTLSRAMRIDALAQGLRDMADAVKESSLRTLLGTGDDPIPMAVLAQPQLELELWCTMEWDPERGQARIEGRQLDSCGDHALLHDAIPLETINTLSESGVGIGALMELARRAQEGSDSVWLLELGMTAGEAVLLQRRPVEHAAPAAATPHSGHLSADGVDEDWAAFPLFESDRSEDWIWDAAHSPRPLAPLLASVFVEWIRERGATHPSRLIDGRWHDRRSMVDGAGASQSITNSKKDPQSATQQLRQLLEHWYSERIPALEHGLEALEPLTTQCLDSDGWRRFVRAWLNWQAAYYDGSAGQLRELASRCLPELPSALRLPDTLARRRECQLDALAKAWDEWDDTERADRLGEFLDEHGHHAPGAWDGYGVPWDEDPSPLVRELERRATAAPSERNTSSASNSAAEIQHREWPGEDAPPESWAAFALAALEDDDDLLAYAYALFRDAALNLEQQLCPEAEEGEILDIPQAELLRLEGAGREGAWSDARARGAALRARWEQAMPEALPPAAEGELLHGHPRLCSGETKGRPRVLGAALENGGPAPGEILVVPTILPGDAVVFSRCAGLICESGEVLGHAAVLAREYQLPALVLPQACERLRGVERIHLDAAAGVVRVVSREESA